MHMMIDLETLSLRSDAAIMNIGLQMFNIEGPEPNILSHAKIRIDLLHSVLEGFHIDPSTVKWWLSADRAARDDLVGGEPLSLLEALGEVTHFFNTNKPERVWSRGAAFDIPILEHAYRRVGMAVPWSHKIVMCHRTITTLGEMFGWKDPVAPFHQAHTVLGDCRYQIEQLQSVWKYLNGALTKF